MSRSAEMLPFAAFVLLAPVTVQAADISLLVEGDESNRPVENAAVILDDTRTGDPVAVSSTGADGRTVLVEVPAGEFRLVVTAPGFATYSRTVRVGEASAALDFGRVALIVAAEDTILVEGSRRRDVSIAPGVNSFDIAGSAIASSGTLTSALRGLPGVTVQSEGTIELRGNDRVRILVDGKPSALTGISNQATLDSIPASNIERIEVINNPSAAQGAQGSAGIINIIMRQDREGGWTGNVGIKGGFGALGRRRDDLPTDLGSFSWTPKVSPYFSLRHGGENVDLNLQGELLRQRRLPNNEFTTRYYDDGRVIVSQVPENRRQTQYVLRGGADWRVSDADLVTFNATFDLENHLDVAEVPYIDLGSGQLTRFWSWRENEQTGHASGAAGYRHEFPEAGHTLSLRAEYIRGWEDETYRLNEISPIRVGTDQTRIVAIENTVPVSLDYVRPFGSGQIEVGAKAQFRWLPVTYTITPGQQSIIYPGLGNRSNWREQIYAGYANLLLDLDWLTLEGGVRAEHTEVSYTLDPANIYYPRDDAYGYFRLFPNVRVTAVLGPDTDLSLFYNRRVDRPGEPELRVFPKYDDPELLKVGNPYLRPQFTTAYEISLAHEWDDLDGSLALFHRHIEDAFERIYAIDASSTQYNIINKVYQNTGVARNTGIELLANWRANGDIKVNGSFNGYRIDRDAATITLLFPYVRGLNLPATRDFTWDAKLGLEAAIGPATKVQLQGQYYAPRDVAQGRQGERSSIDLSLAQEFADRFKASLAITDLFNNFGTSTYVRGAGFDVLYENFYETQTIMLSLEMEI